MAENQIQDLRTELNKDLDFQVIAEHLGAFQISTQELWQFKQPTFKTMLHQPTKQPHSYLGNTSSLDGKQDWEGVIGNERLARGVLGAGQLEQSRTMGRCTIEEK